MLRFPRAVLCALMVAMAPVGAAGASPVTPPRTADCGVPTDTAALRLVVNIPAFRLTVYEGAVQVQTYPVAVGTPAHATPTGEYRISRITWNPWWIPPDRPWAAGARPTPPGPSNPMGRVKLYYEDLYYIHGTPAEHSLETAASHGCVRMANRDAIALARLVHRHASAEISAGTLDSLVASPRATRTIVLSNPVPLEIRYDLARAEAGTLEIFPDVYGRAATRTLDWVVVYLSSLGIATETLDLERLRVLVERSARERVTVPLEQIVKAVAQAGGPIR